MSTGDALAYWECPKCGSNMFGTSPIDDGENADPSGPRQIHCHGDGGANWCDFLIAQAEWDEQNPERVGDEIGTTHEAMAT